MTNIQCSKCKNEIPADSIFCGLCGQTQNSVQETVTAEIVQEPIKQEVIQKPIEQENPIIAPPANPNIENNLDHQPQIHTALNDTKPLRIDDTKKGRIVLSKNHGDMRVSLRRSFGLTELIIDGYVYDERQGITETSYSLDAYVRGNHIVGKHRIRGFATVYIYVNEQLIAKTRRWY